jgi:hypothetical protein
MDGWCNCRTQATGTPGSSHCASNLLMAVVDMCTSSSVPGYAQETSRKRAMRVRLVWKAGGVCNTLLVHGHPKQGSSFSPSPESASLSASQEVCSQQPPRCVRSTAVSDCTQTHDWREPAAPFVSSPLPLQSLTEVPSCSTAGFKRSLSLAASDTSSGCLKKQRVASGSQTSSQASRIRRKLSWACDEELVQVCYFNKDDPPVAARFGTSEAGLPIALDSLTLPAISELDFNGVSSVCHEASLPFVHPPRIFRSMSLPLFKSSPLTGLQSKRLLLLPPPCLTQQSAGCGSPPVVAAAAVSDERSACVDGIAPLDGAPSYLSCRLANASLEGKCFMRTPYGFVH